jgi:hypothetical protein
MVSQDSENKKLFTFIKNKMFEVLSVENTDENCEFSSFALVFGSPCKFPFSFGGAIPEFSHFLFLMKVKSFLFSESWLTMSFTYSLYDDLHSFWVNNLKVSLDKFMDCSDIKTPINNLWSDFKTICLDNLRKHVPSKHTSTRNLSKETFRLFDMFVRFTFFHR